MDLFGIGKGKTPDEAPPAAEAASADAPAAAPRGSHRLWAFLLVLDSVFVVVFAGAVAAKVYQHWRAPAAAAASRRRPAKEAPKPPEPVAAAPVASTAPAAPAPAPAPEQPKEAAKEPAKTEPTHQGGMRPPKPSLLTDAPKPRETPKLAGPGAASAKPAPTPAASSTAGEVRPRAKPIPFRVRATTAKQVELVGAFIVRGGRKAMEKGADGVWEAEIYLHPGQYRYFFSVDKKKVLDPENPRSERGYSLLTVP